MNNVTNVIAPRPRSQKKVNSLCNSVPNRRFMRTPNVIPERVLRIVQRISPKGDRALPPCSRLFPAEFSADDCHQTSPRAPISTFLLGCRCCVCCVCVCCACQAWHFFSVVHSITWIAHSLIAFKQIHSTPIFGWIFPKMPSLSKIQQLLIRKRSVLRVWRAFHKGNNAGGTLPVVSKMWTLAA